MQSPEAADLAVPAESSPASVLLVDVDRHQQDLLRILVEGQPFCLLDLGGDDDAAAAASNVGLVILGTNGDLARCCERVRFLRRWVKEAPLVVLGRMGVDAAVRLMRVGAADVIEVPVQPAHLRSRLLAHLKRHEIDPERASSILGQSSHMRRLRRTVVSLGQMSCTVLLTGETGTGKGLVARAIHRASPRSDKPFVHVDCTGLSATVIESELFGHERGSFTGAVSRRPGRFELAGGGTIFLDEIGDMDPQLQAKLLRVLHDREYERIGGTRTLPMTARVIAATNQDLRAAMKASRFRPDLYFRLQVFELELPPLRSHPEDVPELARATLSRLSRQLEVPLPTITGSFLKRLMAYSWPGNVRELMNVLERLLVRFRGETLEAHHLDGDEEERCGAFAPADGPKCFEVGAGPKCAEVGADERDDGSVIAATLIATGGNVARAARRLGLPRSTLRYRIRRHNLVDLIPAD